MSEFIQVEIDLDRCAGIRKCGECVQICPVNIFEARDDQPLVLEQNQDECILCEQCLKACTPGAVSIKKLYD
jgi:NAD-dependent dihydropyrimidine dehydrogenase PreA subunit